MFIIAVVYIIFVIYGQCYILNLIIFIGYSIVNYIIIIFQLLTLTARYNALRIFIHLIAYSVKIHFSAIRHFYVENILNNHLSISSKHSIIFETIIVFIYIISFQGESIYCLLSCYPAEIYHFQ